GDAANLEGRRLERSRLEDWALAQLALSPQLAEERTHVVDVQPRFLQRREVAPARHLGPAREVVARLDPLPGWQRGLAWEQRARRRDFDAPGVVGRGRF